MILTENLTIGGKDFTKKHSDKNVYIENEGGQRYAEAIDLVDYPHDYTETDIPIDIDPTPEPETDIPVEAEATTETDLTVSDTLEMLSEMGVDTDD